MGVDGITGLEESAAAAAIVTVIGILLPAGPESDYCRHGVKVQSRYQAMLRISSVSLAVGTH